MSAGEIFPSQGPRRLLSSCEGDVALGKVQQDEILLQGVDLNLTVTPTVIRIFNTT